MTPAEAEAEIAKFAAILLEAAPTPTPAIDPILRDMVNSCPHLGGELPLSAYPEGCCPGPTRFVCGAGLGSRPGQPTLHDCLACMGSGLITLPRP